MEHKKTVLLICGVALIIRLLLAFQAPDLSYEAYDTIKQVEHIAETGLPLIHDSLSWQGRTTIPLPVFPYLLAFSTLFLPASFAYILIPNALAVLLHAAIFYLILELTNDARLAGIGAGASIFIPSYLEATLLTLSPLSLALPLFIFSVTLFLKLRKTPEKRLWLLGAFIVLALTHPLAILYVPFLVISLALAGIKRVRGTTAQQEFAVFAVFFLLWFNILFYKESLLAVGLKTVTGNIPASLATANSVTLFGLATAVGIVPFGLALYALYKEGLGEHLGVQVIIALGLTVAVALLAKVMPTRMGLSLLGAVCVTLGAVAIQRLDRYARTLKRSALPLIGTIVVAILFVATNVLASGTAAVRATNDAVSPALLDAADWLRENSPKDSLVLADPAWGALIEVRARQPVYIDNNYLGRTDAEQRLATARGILSGSTPASVAEEKHIDYLFTSTRIDDPCVKTVYEQGVVIGKVLCP